MEFVIDVEKNVCISFNQFNFNIQSLCFNRKEPIIICARFLSELIFIQWRLLAINEDSEVLLEYQFDESMQI